jgi:hypothetical protein
MYVCVYNAHTHTRIRRIRVGSNGMVTRLLLLSVECMQCFPVTTLVSEQTKQYQMKILWVLWTFFRSSDTLCGLSVLLHHDIFCMCLLF